MVSIKETLTKGLTTVNVKTNNFMEQSKCKTYISTLEGEIKDLYLKAGQLLYEGYSKGEATNSDVEEIMQSIAQKYAGIKEQQDKIQNLILQEQQILGTQQSNMETAAIFCSQCGTKNAANYKFCCRCGSALKSN